MDTSPGNRFRQLRLEKNMTQKELIKDFNNTYHYNYSNAALSLIETNQRIPELNALTDFASYFKVSVSYLLGESDNKSPGENIINPKAYGFIQVPVYDFSKIRKNIFSKSNVIDYKLAEKELVDTGTFFYLKALDNSMLYAKISKDDLLLAKRQKGGKTGDILLIVIDKKYFTLRRLLKHSDQLMVLQSENPTYESMLISPEDIESGKIQIIGKIIEITFRV